MIEYLDFTMALTRPGRVKGEPISSERAAPRARTQLQLPLDLWEVVASFMSGKEWAKACCTCKAMQCAKPVKLDIELLNSEALEWAENYWSNARLMNISITSV